MDNDKAPSSWQFIVNTTDGMAYSVVADYMGEPSESSCGCSGIYFYKHSTDPNDPIKAYIVAWFDRAMTVVRNQQVPANTKSFTINEGN